MGRTLTGLGLCALVLLGGALVRHATAAPLQDDGAPINLTIAGGTAQGMFAVLGEAVTETVRRQYPGSALVYEPGNNAGSILRMLRGEVPLSLFAAGEINAAVKGEAPFRQAHAMSEFGVVARLIDGIIGYVVARQDFLQRYDIHDLAGLAARRPPLRLSTNQFGNVSTVLLGRAILGSHGIDEQAIKRWGGKDFHLPNSASFDLLGEGRLDMVITLGLHPEARLLMAARETRLALLPIGTAQLQQVVRDLGAGTGVIPAGTYDFLASDYVGPELSVGIAAGANVDPLVTYKIAKALHVHFTYLQSVHPALAGLDPRILVDAGVYPLHPGARAYYEEVGLLDNPETKIESSERKQ